MRATRLLLAAVAVAAIAGCTRAPGITGPDPNSAAEVAGPVRPSDSLGFVGSGGRTSSSDTTTVSPEDPQPAESPETTQPGLGAIGSGGKTADTGLATGSEIQEEPEGDRIGGSIGSGG